jgi:hypothetical protein
VVHELKCSASPRHQPSCISHCPLTKQREQVRATCIGATSSMTCNQTPPFGSTPWNKWQRFLEAARGNDVTPALDADARRRSPAPAGVNLYAAIQAQTGALGFGRYGHYPIGISVFE